MSASSCAMGSTCSTIAMTSGSTRRASSGESRGCITISDGAGEGGWTMRRWNDCSLAVSSLDMYSSASALEFPVFEGVVRSTVEVAARGRVMLGIPGWVIESATFRDPEAM